MTLTEFLTACLDEDERVAVAAGGREWLSDPDGFREGRVEEVTPPPGEVGVVVYDEGRPTGEEAAHIAAWNPARVLADIAAKRAIVEECADTLSPWDDGQWLAVKTLGLLAQPYAGRDGWDEAWRTPSN